MKTVPSMSDQSSLFSYTTMLNDQPDYSIQLTLMSKPKLYRYVAISEDSRIEPINLQNVLNTEAKPLKKLKNSKANRLAAGQMPTILFII